MVFNGITTVLWGLRLPKLQGNSAGHRASDRNEATLVPVGFYGKCSFEFGVIVVNFKAMIPSVSDSLWRNLEVLCLASH